MKVIGFFVDILCIFAFLTFGSLMMIVALRILPMEDALIHVQNLYESGGLRWQLMAAGGLFIFSGLVLTKALVKKNRSGDEFVLDGANGHLAVSYSSVNRLVQRVLKKFDAIRKSDVTAEYRQGVLTIRTSVVLVAGCNVPSLVQDVEREISDRISKTFGYDMAVDVMVNVTQIEEPLIETAAPGSSN